ncbi:MAG: hypothetical protein ACREMV_02525 [Gemmatimonadales bacterium]
MRERDPLAIGLGALATGIGLGGAVLTLAQLGVAVVAGRLDPAERARILPDPLLFGLIAGLVVAAAFGWRRSHPLDNVWQRGVIAVLAAVGALLVGFLAAVAHRLFGIAGVAVWVALATGFGVAGSRWAIRGSGKGEGGRVLP